MKLSDLMSNMGLSGYAQVAMLLFLAVFIGQTLWIFLPRNRQEFARAGLLPLDDDDNQPRPMAQKSEV